MAATEMAQINARIERGVKIAGDEALASVGISPSAAVRALWTKAARRGKDLEEVRAMVEDASVDAAKRKTAEERIRSMEACRQFVQEKMREMGIDPETFTRSVPIEDYNEIIAEALIERMEERGLR